MKLAMGIPCFDTVQSSTALAFAGAAVNQTAFEGLVLIKGQSSVSAATSRNNLVEGALVSGCSHLLMVDSDMVFPPDTVDRLMEHQVHVVGAVYRRRGHPHDMLGATWDGEQQAEGLTRMKRMATGLMLIDLSVFDDWQKPWFRVEVRGDTIMGEDVLFCEDLIHCNIPFYADVGLSKRVGHLCQATLTEQGIQMSSTVAGFQPANVSESRILSSLP